MTRGTRVSRASPQHTLPAFLNLHGTINNSNYQKKTYYLALSHKKFQTLAQICFRKEWNRQCNLGDRRDNVRRLCWYICSIGPNFDTVYLQGLLDALMWFKIIWLSYFEWQWQGHNLWRAQRDSPDSATRCMRNLLGHDEIVCAIRKSLKSTTC